MGDTWKDGTSSHERPVQQDFDYHDCAQRVLESGSICGGCHFDQRCKINTLFKEKQEAENQGDDVDVNPSPAAASAKSTDPTVQCKACQLKMVPGEIPYWA